MSFFSRFSKKKNYERVLFVDIGSGAVSTAVVYFGNAKPEVLGSAHQVITISKQLTLLQLQKNMLEALSHVLVKTQKLHLPVFDRVCVCLSSPWFNSQVRSIRKNQAGNFSVTKQILDDMIGKEIHDFSNTIITQTHGTDLQLRHIESRTLAVHVNGYSVQNPLGMTANEVVLSLFTSVAYESLLEDIENRIARIFPARNITFSSSISVGYYVSRMSFPHSDQALLVSIDGETTDVSLIHDGVLHSTQSFFIGSNSVVRALAQALKRPLHEAKTLWKLSLECKVDGPVKQVCTKTLVSSRSEWVKSFHVTISKILGATPAPKSIIVTVESDAVSWFLEAINHENVSRGALGVKHSEIHVLNPSVLHGSLSFKCEIPRDTSLLIAIIGAEYLRRNTSMVQ
jgi:cell division ATPase FtsA